MTRNIVAPRVITWALSILITMGVTGSSQLALASDVCPCFNASMIDAGLARIEQNVLNKNCGQETFSGPGGFYVSINFDSIASPGFPELRVFTQKNQPGAPVETSCVFDSVGAGIQGFRSSIGLISESEVHACRSEILKSYAWKRFCED